MKQLLPVAQAAFVLAAGVFVYFFVSAAKDGEERRACTALCLLRPDYANDDRTAPDFELDTLRHGKVRLSSYRGKTVVMNFWTKTCRPCLEEMPSFAELAELVRGRKDLVVLTVSTDESLDDIRATLSSVLGKEPPFVAAVDPESAVVAGKYGTKLFPETWIVDPDGVIRTRFDGPRSWSSPLVLELLENLGGRTSCPVAFENQEAVAGTEAVCERVEG